MAVGAVTGARTMRGDAARHQACRGRSIAPATEPDGKPPSRRRSVAPPGRGSRAGRQVRAKSAHWRDRTTHFAMPRRGLVTGSADSSRSGRDLLMAPAVRGTALLVVVLLAALL